METITPVAWLLVIIALILGFLAGYFKFKPQVPPLVTDEIIRIGDHIKIPAKGGTANFTDQAGKEFQIRLPEQIPPREIIFRNLEKEKFEPLLVDGKPNPKVPNPTNKPVHRIIIKLTAEDANGRKVERFHPMMTTISKYIEENLRYVDGDPRRLRRYYHDGIEWIELGMPKNAVDTKNKTLTAYVVTFSSCADGG